MAEYLLPYQRLYLRSCAPNTNCPICLTEIEGQGAFHSGDNGKQHPFHQGCLTTSRQYSPYCPICRELLPVSATEKVKHVFSQMTKHEVACAVACGLLVGALDVAEGGSILSTAIFTTLSASLVLAGVAMAKLNQPDPITFVAQEATYE